MTTYDVAYRGKRRTIRWATTSAGRMPGGEFFGQCNKRDQAKILAPLMRVGDVWEMPSRERFRKLEGDVFEVKPTGQVRMACFFGAGGSVIVTHGFVKKRAKTPRKEIDRAQRIMRECTERGEPNEQIDP